MQNYILCWMKGVKPVVTIKRIDSDAGVLVLLAKFQRCDVCDANPRDADDGISPKISTALTADSRRRSYSEQGMFILIIECTLQI